MQVDRSNMLKNFKRKETLLIAEPLYILLASSGHSDAHEYVRRLSMESLKSKKPLYDVAREEEGFKPYLEKLTDLQKEIISNPSRYIGIASKKAERVVEFWQKKLEEMELA